VRTVKLGSLLKRRNVTVPISPTSSYQEVTVRLWGKGVVSRGVIPGARIGSDRRFQVKCGELLLSRIDARNGAIGIVPSDLDGAVVTNDFPVFDIDQSQLDRSFIHWITKSSLFVEECARASEGTTNRVRLKEDRFLNIEIRLPALQEQTRLSERVAELNNKLTDAHRLRVMALSELDALVPSLRDRLFSQLQSDTTVTKRQLGEVARIRTGYAFRSEDYRETGSLIFRVSNIRENGDVDLASCVYLDPTLEEKLSEYRLLVGDILMVMVGGSVGKLCMLPPAMPPALMNQNMWRFNPLNPQELSPRYLFHFLHWCNNNLKSGLTSSTHGHLTQTVYKAYKIPVPSVVSQKQIEGLLDAALDKVRLLKGLQAEGDREVRAILPTLLNNLFLSGGLASS